MKILHLTLRKKWFDMIYSGEKKEEYREIKPYWSKRLREGGLKNNFTHVSFTNGYGGTKPNILYELERISIGHAKEGWIDEDFTNTEVYVIRLGEKVSEKNIK